MNEHPAAGARRIAILVGSMSVGGAERVAATLAHAWTSEGSQVWLVSTFLGSACVDHEVARGVRTVFLRDRVTQSERNWRRTLRKVGELRRLIKEIRPDVVVSFLTNVNVLAIIALAAARVPLIVAERTDPAAGVELPWVVRALRAISYPFADGFVVQTAAAARRYRARLPCLPPVSVIPNPLPLALHQSLKRAQISPAGGRVVSMGRLTESKGFDRLIRAFDAGLGENPAWELTIWGEGSQRKALERLAAELECGARISLPGLTDAPWSALAEGQIFALSSAYEGFPNVMLEAMALGLPCVAFDCPSGPRELADGGAAAVLVPPDDDVGFARALRALALDPLARESLGRRAAAHVRSAFSEHDVMQQWTGAITRARRRASRSGGHCTPE